MFGRSRFTWWLKGSPGRPSNQTVCALRVTLHRGNRGVSGVLAHHPRGGQNICRDRHGPDRPYPAVARRYGSLSPRSGAPVGRDRGALLHSHDASLQDFKQTKVLLATLAETTPVLEAANLQADLRRAGIQPWAWIINNSVAAARPRSPLLRQRARNELREVEAVASRHARRYAVVPLLRDEPIGVHRLLELAGRVSELNLLDETTTG